MSDSAEQSQRPNEGLRERITYLERELKGATEVVGMIVAAAGGEVRLTRRVLVDHPTKELMATDDPMTGDRIYFIRAALTEERNDK